MSGNDQTPAAFVPVVTRKTTDLIADQIRQRIFAREFATGELLPSEAELVRQTESSSASVRGALRALEAQGLIQMRSGRAGGAVVRLPGEDELAATVTQLIRGHSLDLDALLEMQQAIEPVCAELAAHHRTDDDVTELRAAVARITASADTAAMIEAHGHWHRLVARASHNELLAGLMVALVTWIFTAVEENAHEITRVESAAYEEITDAIVDRDAARARARMREHATSRARSLRSPRSTPEG